MTQQELLTFLREGFDLQGRHFYACLYLQEVNEPFYGCEERGETDPMGSIAAVGLSGCFTVCISEEELNTCGLYDDMWLGHFEDRSDAPLYCWQPRRQLLKPCPSGPWLSRLGLIQDL